MPKYRYMYLLGYMFETNISDTVYGGVMKTYTSQGYGSCRYWAYHKIGHEDDLNEIENDLLNGDVGKNIDGDVQKISIMSFSFIRKEEYDNGEI